jgi:hypothetical protein
MKLHEIPCFNREMKDLPLREQLVARIRQIDGGYYRQAELDRMSDYALLCAFEATFSVIADRSIDEWSTEMFDAGIAYGMEKAAKSQPQNETFTMKEGELIASSRDFK